MHQEVEFWQYFFFLLMTPHSLCGVQNPKDGFGVELPSPGPSLSPALQQAGGGEEMTIFVDWNKDREPAHQQPSQEKRPPLGEFIYCQLK